LSSTASKAGYDGPFAGLKHQAIFCITQIGMQLPRLEMLGLIRGEKHLAK